MRGDRQTMAGVAADRATFAQEIQRMKGRQARAMARGVLLRDGAVARPRSMRYPVAHLAHRENGTPQGFFVAVAGVALVPVPAAK